MDALILLHHEGILLAIRDNEFALPYPMTAVNFQPLAARREVFVV